MVAIEYASAPNMDPKPPKSNMDEMLYILLPNYSPNDSASVLMVAITNMLKQRKRKFAWRSFQKYVLMGLSQSLRLEK